MEIEVIEICAENPLFNADDAAEYLCISKTSLNKLVREGRLIAVQLTADRKYRRSDLNRLVAESLALDWKET